MHEWNQKPQDVTADFGFTKIQSQKIDAHMLSRHNSFGMFNWKWKSRISIS